MIYPQSFEEKIGMTNIRQLLKTHCLSPLGEQRVDEMTFLTDCAAIRQLHQQTGEFVRLMEVEDLFPTSGFYDLRPMLDRLRIEGTYIETDEMFALKRALETTEGIVSILTIEKMKNETAEDESAGEAEALPYPALAQLGTARFSSFNFSVFKFIKVIDRILDKFGHIKDSASPELARIRRELVQAEGSVSRVLNAILRSAQAEGTVASDVAPTMRDGRLVIPVVPALKRKIKGIVHDESATGKTVFIEPQEVVEANNQIRELENDERREIIRILREFSNEIRPQIPQLKESFELLADIDFVRAKALLASQFGAFTTTEPQISNHPLMDWTLAVHPLLRRSLERHGKKVVPLDIELNRRQRILIISGPNAGGKSVCLKTVGLLQYMFQCGLPITVGERSQLGIFSHIMIDIGDEQSIEDELSTYSSHLLNMKQMMKNADPETLLLIDEFGGGTEPQIGGAMAEAVLKRFVKNGAFGVITTHYQNLKHFAEETEGVVNGAMLYDRHLMQPLFQLQIGNPGSSFAVEIARKIGIPEEVINDASEIVGRDYINADKWLQDIVRDKRYWETKRQNIHSREKQMEQTIARYEQEVNELQRQRKEIIRKAKEEAEQLLQDSNARIENTIREIREAQAEKEQTRRARQQLDDFKIKQVESDTDDADDVITRKMEKIRRRQEKKMKGTDSPHAPDSPPALPIREGAVTFENEKLLFAKHTAPSLTGRAGGESTYVRLKGQSTVGQLISIDGKNATVVFGQMRTTVKADRLVPAQAPKKEESPSGVTFLGRETQTAMREKSLHFQQDIDVRGMRGDEALNAITHFIDDATQVGVARVRILHGTGTGILRQLIRQYLKTVPNVVDARDEHVQFGGAGITIVDLA